MKDRFKFRGKRIDNGEWIEGYYATDYPNTDREMILTPDINGEYGGIYYSTIDPATIGQCTGLRDKNGTLVFEGDIMRLILADGEVRHFEVDSRTVIRNVVSHPTFDDATAKVAITGVVFLWRGFELFPCIDESGVADNIKMEIIGNIHDNPELLEATP